jgi:hypothetical protein
MRGFFASLRMTVIFCGTLMMKAASLVWDAALGFGGGFLIGLAPGVGWEFVAPVTN